MNNKANFSLSFQKLFIWMHRKNILIRNFQTKHYVENECVRLQILQLNQVIGDLETWAHLKFRLQDYLVFFWNTRYRPTSNSHTFKLPTCDFTYLMNSPTQYIRLPFRLLDKIANLRICLPLNKAQLRPRPLFVIYLQDYLASDEAL